MLTLLLLAASPPILDVMKSEAKAYAPQVKADWVKKWMTAVASLPTQPKKTFYRTKDRSKALSEADFKKLRAEEQKAYDQKVCDDDVYYGRITEPLGYARPFDVLAEKTAFAPKGKRIVDFGYGNIGQLEGLVAVGAKEASGIEIDPILPLLYAKANRPALRILHGFFPKDEALTRQLGQKYDLFVSKNTLKKGYIHPDRELTEEQRKMQVDLGVSDETFVTTVAGLLNPKGLFFIYNITPAPSPPDKPFVPWSDGRSPFTKETYEKAGFEVLAFDEDDSPKVREMAKAFGWDQPDGDQPGTDLEHDLFAHYTLLEKR